MPSNLQPHLRSRIAAPGPTSCLHFPKGRHIAYPHPRYHSLAVYTVCCLRLVTGPQDVCLAGQKCVQLQQGLLLLREWMLLATASISIHHLSNQSSLLWITGIYDYYNKIPHKGGWYCYRLCACSVAPSCPTLFDPMDWLFCPWKSHVWSGSPIPSPGDHPYPGFKPLLSCLLHCR